MLRFPSPLTRLKFSKMNDAELQDSSKVFDSFPIHSIHLSIPSSNAYQERYEDLLISEENTYFIVNNIPVSCLIKNAFLECFLRSGSVLGVTINARVEADNFLSIISPGKLVLSLERNIAQSLSLYKEKDPQKKKKKRKKSFETIIVDLTSSELSPGKKLYKSIAFELSKIDYLKFTVLLKWRPKGDICPQSLKSFFTGEGFECVACKPTHKYSSKFSMPVPKLKFDMGDSDTYNEVLEWIGLQLCGLNYSTDEDEYVSRLTVPDSFEIVDRLHKCSFEGFYSKFEVLSVIKEISKIFESHPSLPFIVMCLNGFQDSYIQANGFQLHSSDDKYNDYFGRKLRLSKVAYID